MPTNSKINVKTLSLAFALAAGVTSGTIIGVGQLVHGGNGASIKQTRQTAPAVTAPTGGEEPVPALVTGHQGNTLFVRAHTWVGQFNMASICLNDTAPKTCSYDAAITDAAGKPLENVRTGDTVYLSNLKPASGNVAPVAVPVDIGNIRPRQDEVPGPVKARVVKLVDGDTVQVMADIWPGNYVLTDIRVGGIDTPEKKGRAKCAAEAALAEKASAETKALLEGKQVLLYNVKFEKYGGRVLGDIKTVTGQNLADDLVGKGLARPYDGGTKQSWCATGK